jgi:hypothetical protein
MKLDTRAFSALFAVSASLVACGDDFASHPSALVNSPADEAAGAVIRHDADADVPADGASLTAACGDCEERHTPDTCHEPAFGCPCDPDTLPVACDLDTGGPRTPATCYIGQRNCTDRAWTRCIAYAPRYPQRTP